MDLDLFHSLEMGNVYFKPLSMTDAPTIHEYASDEDVSRFIGWNLMKNLEETTAYVETMINREIAGTHLYAVAMDKMTHTHLGTVMIFNFDKEANHAEVGYVFHKAQWGKGYGSTCVKMMCDFAFESLLLHKLVASVTDANIGSARILEKNGFELEGRLKDHFYIENRYYDDLLFGKINQKK